MFTKIINKSNNIVIGEKIQIADNPVSRMIGLLNKSNLLKGEGILLKSCNNIHSFGMKFTFDAVFIDKQNRVKYLISEMKPFRVSPIVFSACSVLELPVNTIKNTGLKLNDELLLKYND